MHVLPAVTPTHERFGSKWRSLPRAKQKDRGQRRNGWLAGSYNSRATATTCRALLTGAAALVAGTATIALPEAAAPCGGIPERLPERRREPLAIEFYAAR
jgi:hypothetical protein